MAAAGAGLWAHGQTLESWATVYLVHPALIDVWACVTITVHVATKVAVKSWRRNVLESDWLRRIHFTNTEFVT